MMTAKKDSAIIRVDEEDRQIAAYINAEHGAALQAGRISLAAAGEYLFHAANAGEALIAKKERLGHGGFLPWIEANLTFSRTTAWRYMDKAKEAREALKCSTVEHLDPTKATAFLANGQEEEEPEEPSGEEIASPEQEEPSSEPENQEDEEQQEEDSDEEEGKEDREEEAPARYTHSDTLCAWMRAVMGQTLVIRMEQGGIKEMLAERDKWDWKEVRSYLLPALKDLGQCISEFRKEIERAATTQT